MVVYTERRLPLQRTPGTMRYVWPIHQGGTRHALDIPWAKVRTACGTAFSSIASWQPLPVKSPMVLCDGALGVADGRIAFVGPRADLAGAPEQLARHVHGLNGAWVTPGLIDCHTHTLYAGNGVLDFEMRLAGATRQELYSSGGGVPGAVQRARAASDTELFEAAVRRVSALVANGVTVLEIKSGFGLDDTHERRHPRLIRRLGKELPITVKSTFLGAHGLPPEYAGRPDAYIDFLCDTVLPAAVAEGLVDAVDGFCDAVGFTHAQIGRLFDIASAWPPVKLHADQYSNFLLVVWRCNMAPCPPNISNMPMRQPW